MVHSKLKSAALLNLLLGAFLIISRNLQRESCPAAVDQDIESNKERQVINIIEFTQNAWQNVKLQVNTWSSNNPLIVGFFFFQSYQEVLRLLMGVFWNQSIKLLWCDDFLYVYCILFADYLWNHAKKFCGKKMSVFILFWIM